MNKTNIFLGLVGCFVFPAGVILSGVRHHWVSAALQALFAAIYIGHTALLLRRARHGRRPDDTLGPPTLAQG